MHKEGLTIVVGMLISTGILVTGAVITSQSGLSALATVAFLLFALSVYFFRDPERTLPADPNAVVSPADGKVVEIKDQKQTEFLQEASTRVSVFLSIVDVHVNRIPMSGTVKHFRYQRGSFVNAMKGAASEINEQTVIGIQNGKRKILFKQIAGLIARRIVCDVREGNRVAIGERCGIIKFGSRVDIFLPMNADIQVKLHQRVKGGESIIGVFTDDN